MTSVWLYCTVYAEVHQLHVAPAMLEYENCESRLGKRVRWWRCIVSALSGHLSSISIVCQEIEWDVSAQFGEGKYMLGR